MWTLKFQKSKKTMQLTCRINVAKVNPHLWIRAPGVGGMKAATESFQGPQMFHCVLELLLKKKFDIKLPVIRLILMYLQEGLYKSSRRF